MEGKRTGARRQSRSRRHPDEPRPDVRRHGPADYTGGKPLSEPLRVKGEVVKGFGRGSKELGIPTANLPIEALGEAVDSLESGVYVGWAAISGKGPYKMVMSVGW